MADEKRSGFCTQCNERRVVFRKGTSHILHLLLSIITFGFWLIIWFGSAVKFGGWRCMQCGSSKIKNVD